MKIFVINLEHRADRLSFISSQLQNYDWQAFTAVNGHTSTLDTFEQDGFKPFKRWKDPLLNRNLTITEVATSISHFKLWEKCVALNEPILILEDDSQLVNNLDLNKLAELANSYDIIYLDHKEMYPNEAQLQGDLIVPYYPYWNNAYVITPRLASAIIKSEFRYNLFPVDELFPLISGVDYNLHCLGRKEQFIELKNTLRGIKSNPIAFQQSVFRQVSRKILGSDIENGREIMQNVHVLTVATDESRLKYLSTSAKRFGINFVNLGHGVEWQGGTMQGPGGGQKLNLVKQYIINLPPDDIVLFVDGYDVFFNDDLSTIVNRFTGFNCKVLFAGEKNCWPDTSLSGLFKGDTEYRHLNSGVYMGYVSSISSLINDYIDNAEDDQLFLQKKYIVSTFEPNSPYKIDTENYVFQCLAGATQAVTIKANGQLLNTETRCCPCILHGNGGDTVKTHFDRLYSGLFGDSESKVEFVEPNGYNVVAPDVLELDFLTPDMCAKLIERAEKNGEWKSMYGDKFPAQEMRIRDFDMDLFNRLEEYLKSKVYPLIEQYWFPLQMYGIRDAFIIKYSPETQASLRCHHDASLVSGNVKLNDGYTGGETYFYRQNYSNINTPVGKIVLWPGQVTHGHEGKEVTSGTKYNLVIWTSRRPGDINY